MRIYKVFRPDEWTAFEAEGRTAGSDDDREDGFIHFSTAAQLPGTLKKHFSDDPETILLACETDGMGDALKWEEAGGGARFPHLYRELRADDVVWHRPLIDNAVPDDLE